MTDCAVRDPRSDEVVRTSATASGADIEAALEQALAASAVWGRSTEIAQRAERVTSVAQLQEQRRPERAGAVGAHARHCR
ncbi:MAG: aldehyde dehydrogenase family protein [Nocardioidaceae bacterium]